MYYVTTAMYLERGQEMKCKKSIMGLAALLIFIFHFYIPFGNSSIEMSLYKATYIGVDLFFFVSAYSLSLRKIDSYWTFIKNRIIYVYVPFVCFSIISALYNGWTFIRLISVISGYEFFVKGGGAFLWFFSGIMLFYLVAPFLLSLKYKYGAKSIAIMCVIWAVLVAIMQYGLNYTKIFILLNRLPICFIGLFYDDIRKIKFGKLLYPILAGLFIIGLLLVYKYGSIIRVNKPIDDFYYIIALPLTLSIEAIMDTISTKSNAKYKLLESLGKFTLELYGLQMIFGFSIESYFVKNIAEYKQIAFVLTFLIILGMSILFNYLRLKITKIILR